MNLTSTSNCYMRCSVLSKQLEIAKLVICKIAHLFILKLKFLWIYSLGLLLNTAHRLKIAKGLRETNQTEINSKIALRTVRAKWKLRDGIAISQVVAYQMVRNIRYFYWFKASFLSLGNKRLWYLDCIST